MVKTKNFKIAVLIACGLAISIYMVIISSLRVSRMNNTIENILSERLESLQNREGAFGAPSVPLWLGVYNERLVDSFVMVSSHVNESGEVWFFLPSFAENDSSYLVFDEGSLDLLIDGKRVDGFKKLKDIEIDVKNAAYGAVYPEGLKGKETDFSTLKDGKILWEDPLCHELSIDGESYPLFFVKSKGTASMHIETESGSLDHIYENKRNKEDAFMVLIDKAGEVGYEGDLSYIKGHGNTTWRKNIKKPFHIKLKESTPLLGMDSLKDWILLINGNTDPSFVRNTVVLRMAREAKMPYTSNLEYVDLYINDEYRGNYILTEKIDTEKFGNAMNDLQGANDELNGRSYRMDNEVFGEYDDDLKGIKHVINPPDITGGYLLERNYGTRYEQRLSGFRTDYNDAFVIRAPAYASEEQTEYIYNLFQKAEEAIFSPEGYGLDGKYFTEYIDIDSFVNKYLLEEIILNESQAGTSSWFYKLNDAVSKKIFAGPAWDYDKALHGIDDPAQGASNPRTLSRLRCYGSAPTEMFAKLYEKKDFNDLVRKRYKEVFRPVYSSIDGLMYEYWDKVKDSARMNILRWEEYEVEPIESIRDMSSFAKARIEFLDRVWIDGEKDHLLRFISPDGWGEYYVTAIDGESLKMPWPRVDKWSKEDEEEMVNKEDVIWVDKDSMEEYRPMEEIVPVRDMELMAVVK